jgi:Zn-dependent M16 (insulinase) family peptidase
MSFTLTQSRTIPEINATGKLFIHDKTGARVLSIVNNDENKVFGITFRTPPADSTGIAHIMEHSVLCGSRKYPVKEPFVEILKGSLQTFVNAFTFPDKTCYPLASQNLKDFYNLVDVYLDAVFYPLIPEQTLAQEGWHYEIDAPEAPLTLKGVVFNEMKGAYSSPDDLLGDKSRASLFPGHTYGLDSGGDPLAIPDLTYAAFKTFHETYYHPSNAYIYFYGDDPEAERLSILDTWLKDFDKKAVDSAIPLQPKFEAPKKLTYPYDSGDSADAKAYLTLNWLLPPSVDLQTTLSLSLLTHILLATPASPLKKALIESGLGEDITGGFEEQLRQTTFSAGLKGVQPENLDQVEKLILETLASLAREGLDPETVAASLNTVEFALRERNTGRFPRGLALMLGALTTWLYDGDPLEALAFEAPLAAIKDALRAPRYFENLIQKHLLDNPHRTTVTLIPDPAEGQRRAALETERLEKIKSALNADEIQEIITQAAELKRRQETPDSPEALATIPALKLSDIDKAIRTIPIQMVGNEGRAADAPSAYRDPGSIVSTPALASGASVRAEEHRPTQPTSMLHTPPILHHDLFTNNILYLDLGFDLHALPQELLPYAGLFGRLLLEMGTEKDDFVKLTQRIGRDTGGLRAASLTSARYGESGSAAWLFLRGKAVASSPAALLKILKEILLTARFDNRERFKQIVLEEKSGLEAGLVPGGHGVVNRRLRAHFNEADWIAEQIGGITQLIFLREVADLLEKDWSAVLAKLEAVRAALIHQGNLLANVTLDAANWQVFEPQLEAFLDELRAADPKLEVKLPAWSFPAAARSEGLTIPAQVNFVGKGADLYKLGYQLHGSVQVINNYLGTTWLWEKIRVQGGAYGGFSAFDQHSGVYTFLSYRDPNLLASLDNYDATAGFLRALELSDEELTKAIIGTIGDLDAYQLPDAKGWTSLTRALLGLTDARRQQFRDEVLGTTLKDFKAFGETLAEAAKHGEIVVLGSAEAIEKANQERAGLLEVKKVL